MLAIDWPDELTADDRYVMQTRELFQRDMCPAIRSLLGHWEGELSSVVELEPLGSSPPTTPDIPSSGRVAATPTRRQGRPAGRVTDTNAGTARGQSQDQALLITPRAACSTGRSNEYRRFPGTWVARGIVRPTHKMSTVSTVRAFASVTVWQSRPHGPRSRRGIKSRAASPSEG